MDVGVYQKWVTLSIWISIMWSYIFLFRAKDFLRDIYPKEALLLFRKENVIKWIDHTEDIEEVKELIISNINVLYRLQAEYEVEAAEYEVKTALER